MRISIRAIHLLKSKGSGEVFFWVASALLMLAMIVVATELMRADVSIGVLPIRVEHDVAAGHTKTDGITVENSATEPVHIRVTVADWFLEKEGTPVFVKRGRRPEFSMSEWMEVNPSEFDLTPHGKQLIRYTFRVPVDAPAGGYHTAVLIESVPNILPGKGLPVAYLNGRIAAIIYNRVGQTSPQGVITSQGIGYDPGNTGQIGVHVTLKNSGASHFRFKGESRIFDSQGTLLEKLMIHDSVVLPHTERSIFLPMKSSVPAGTFSIVTDLDIGLKELLEAETRVEASTQNRALEITGMPPKSQPARPNLAP